MGKITVLNEKAIAVEVPEDAFNFEIYQEATDRIIIWQNDRKVDDFFPLLPIGSWSILGRPEDLLFIHKTDMVEKENDGSGHLRSWWYKEYITDSWVKDVNVSFASLLETKGLIDKSIIILIKQ